ncbi:Bifunctional polymyxin resistance protein ArnA [Dissostichus eleginoides]|uniref:Bifunctional polymyxin resistance protein ArnA n=1 Tax=Dissostichus eleginoides TaxID=100907 RepID=A0AAD9CTQ0_DISEL|nr:Bifunctional polymyxin resistance protein ArnA [Dissostichus eleginoides]
MTVCMNVYVHGAVGARRAGEELFQSFREHAAKLHFLPRPCSRRQASQPNGGRACQAACAPAREALKQIQGQTPEPFSGAELTEQRQVQQAGTHYVELDTIEEEWRTD